MHVTSFAISFFYNHFGEMLEIDKEAPVTESCKESDWETEMGKHKNLAQTLTLEDIGVFQNCLKS